MIISYLKGLGLMLCGLVVWIVGIPLLCVPAVFCIAIIHPIVLANGNPPKWAEWYINWLEDFLSNR